METINAAKVEIYLRRIFPYVGAGILALAAAGVLLAATGKNPFEGYRILFVASFGSAVSIELLILEFIPLFLMALAFAVPLVTGKYNVGNEGQFLAGAIGAITVGLNLLNLSSLAAIPLLLLMSITFGALWAVIPAYMLYRFKVNEIVSTIAMNFIASYLVLYIATGPWKDPYVGFPQTLPVSAFYIFPAILNYPRINLGFIFAILVPLAIYFFVYKTSMGYELRVSGSNPRAASIYGVKSNLMSSLSLILGGALAGLAGGIQVAGLLHSMQYKMESNYAALSYVAALIAPGNIAGLAVASVFLAALETGVSALQGATGVPADLGLIIEALLVLLILLANVHKGGRPKWLHL